MAKQSGTFSEADAACLRQNAPSFNATDPRDFQTASPELQRYFHHYGFGRLLEQPIAHSLNFHQWHHYQIASHCWRTSDARGTVILAHGLFDHCGLYLRLVQRLLQENYNVVAFDWPGHGLSDGDRVTIKHFSEYSAVLRHCLAWCAASQAAPFFAVGQSTGCAGIMHLMMDGGIEAESVRKAVFLAPLVRPHAWTKVVITHSLFGGMLPRVPRHFGVNSHDKQFLHFLCHQDPLQTRYIATSWVKALRGWVAKVASSPTVAGYDILAIQGTADATVDWRWNLPLIQQTFPGTQVAWVQGGFHHLVNEADPWRSQVFAALTAHFTTP